MSFKKRTLALIIGSIVIVSSVSIGIIVISQQGVLGLHIAYDVYVQGNYAYVTNNDGVKVLNVQNPEKPISTSKINSPDGAFGVYVKNDLLFIASDSDGFTIANISNPENPEIISEFTDDGDVYEVYVEGSYAYVVNIQGSLKIFDVSDLGSPIGTYEGGIWPSVAARQGIVYFTASNGLAILNATDPTSPTKIRTISGTTGVMDIYLHEDLMFLGRHELGVKILNISNPISPEIIGYFTKSGGEAYGVTGNETHLYVADLQKGVYLLNITDPSLPTEIAHYDNAASHDIFYDGKYIYIADQDRELIILESDLTPAYAGQTTIPGFNFFAVFIGIGTIYLFKSKRGIHRKQKR